MSVIDKIRAKAAADVKHVVLAEGTEPRTVQAAEKIVKLGLAKITLVGAKAEIEAKAAELGVDLTGVSIADPATSEKTASYAEQLFHIREKKGMTLEKATELCLKNTLFYGTMMLKMGDADAMVAGAINTTGDVLMAAQMIIGLADGVDVPSILALVQTPGFAGPEGDVIALTDCGLNPEPTAEELASIAIAACDNVSALMDWEPRCAFISYSTDGSGESESVERIRKAISIARDRRPDLALDGEFQLDAAISRPWRQRRSSARAPWPAARTCSCSPTSTAPTAP